MNSLVGWIVGGVILVGVGLLIAMLVFFPSHSDPTEMTTAPGALDLHQMTMTLTDVLGAEPTGDGNAADDYAKALDVYRKDRETWKALNLKMVNAMENAVVGDVEKDLMKQFADHCHDGAKKANMDYCVAYGQKPSIEMEQADSKALEKLCECLQTCLLYQQLVVKDSAAAQQIGKDMLILGWHITKERAYPLTVMAGYNTQGAACERLAEIYKSDPKLAAADTVGRLRDYRSQAQTVLRDSQHLLEMWKANPLAGDFFNVIDNTKDPAWRVQGLLGLGIIKFRSEGDRGDRMYTQRLLEKYSTSGTELEKRAAKAAKDFTREEYQHIGNLEVPEP